MKKVIIAREIPGKPGEVESKVLPTQEAVKFLETTSNTIYAILHKGKKTGKYSTLKGWEVAYE